MATLNIEGRSVTIDDAFLKASPEQQEATVNEIARSLKLSPGGAQGRKEQGSAFSDVKPEIKEEAGSAIDAMKRLGDRGKMGTFEGPLATARAVAAVPQLLFSPLVGAARSMGGHAIANAETGVGGLINPEVARQRDQSGAAYEDAKHDVDTALALSGFAGRGVPVASAAAPAAAATRGGRAVEAAARRLGETIGSPVTVPRAISSDSMAVQRLGQGVRNLPIVGDAIPKATNQLVEDLGGATRSIADAYGTGNGPNVASRIGQTLRDAGDTETQAATGAARRSDEAVQAAWQRNTDAAYADIANREAISLEAAREALGDLSPQDMGEAVIARLRGEEGAARARKEALYDRAGSADAAVRADEVGNVRARVAQGLDDAGVVVDPQLTPAASKMLDELQRLSELQIPNRAVGARVASAGDEIPAAVSVQGLEQSRKRLNFMRSAASSDADRRAAGQVMRHFDDWQSHAFENALYSGSDEALSAFRQARAANAEWRDRFFNNDDDAGKVINSIVTGERTPQEVANYLIGAGQVGAKGVSSRLLGRIAEITGDDPEAMQAIRGGVWNRLSQAIDGPKPGPKAAADIRQFLYGSGRDVAERLYTPAQRQLMRAYADTIGSAQEARQLVGEVASATKPGTMEVSAGPMQQLADAVLGKGLKSDEAIFNTIDAYAKSGNRADVSTLAKLVNALPEELKGDLAGAVIRKLGISPRTGEFSPEVFVSQWRAYSPQAKAVLFRNAGAQRVALDDIATISDRMKQVGKNFGNPSGTAQHRNLAAAGAAIATMPLKALAAGVGGYITARILAAPAGAASAAKWSKAVVSATKVPSPSSTKLLQVASRNLANTAQGLGLSVTATDLLQAAQHQVAPQEAH